MTREDVPDYFLLQHRNTYDYQLNDWGVTLPFNRWSVLKDDEYYINIDVKWGDGSMKVGEYILPGKRDDILCIHVVVPHTLYDPQGTTRSGVVNSLASIFCSILIAVLLDTIWRPLGQLRCESSTSIFARRLQG